MSGLGGTSLSVINAITQFVGGTTATWNDVTVPIPDGLWIYASDTTNLKKGDGVHLYADLPVEFTLSSLLAILSGSGGYVTNAALATALGAYVTNATLAGDLAGLSSIYATLTGLASALSGYMPVSAGPFAALLGSASQNFNVADAISEHNAVALGQYTFASAAGGWALKFPSGQIFQCAIGTSWSNPGTGSSQTIPWISTFPNGVYGAPFTSQINGGGGTNNWLQIGTWNSSGASVLSINVYESACNHSGTTTPVIFALGH